MPMRITQPHQHHVPRHRDPPFDPKAIAVHGMQGLGDNLHQRAVVRQLMAKWEVYLETPWPCIYHDLVGPSLHLVRRASSLRTQAKNAAREARRFEAMRLPVRARQVRVWYTGEEVRTQGSILQAMLKNTGCDVNGTDFRLPIPDAWLQLADVWLRQWAPTKPVLIYRPLVERTEWKGCAQRNPDAQAYSQIFAAIRKYFFVVSVADLVPGVEWLSGRPIDADVALHKGELTFEMLAALVSRSALVFCSPGFATLLAQAVGTPAVCVFGGHESSTTIRGGMQYAPTLGIDPVVPCDCFSHTHACQKAIDIPGAIARLLTFVERNVRAYPGTKAAVANDRLVYTTEAFHESRRTRDAVRPVQHGAPAGGSGVRR